MAAAQEQLEKLRKEASELESSAAKRKEEAAAAAAEVRPGFLPFINKSGTT